MWSRMGLLLCLGGYSIVVLDQIYLLLIFFSSVEYLKSMTELKKARMDPQHTGDLFK